MNRHLFVLLVALGLLMIAAAGAYAEDFWPHWDTITERFPFRVSATQTSTGWDYTVSVDPTHAYPGFGVQAFAVYPSNVTMQRAPGWGGYEGGAPASWTYDGGWAVDKYPGPAGTTAAFGWVTWSGAYITSGSSATFHAVNLPSGFEDWGKHFAVRVRPPESTTGFGALCDLSYWARTSDPPEETPEPGSVALFALGAGAVFGIRKRRVK